MSTAFNQKALYVVSKFAVLMVEFTSSLRYILAIYFPEMKAKLLSVRILKL